MLLFFIVQRKLFGRFHKVRPTMIIQFSRIIIIDDINLQMRLHNLRKVRKHQPTNPIRTVNRPRLRASSIEKLLTVQIVPCEVLPVHLSQLFNIDMRIKFSLPFVDVVNYVNRVLTVVLELWGGHLAEVQDFAFLAVHAVAALVRQGT